MVWGAGAGENPQSAGIVPEPVIAIAGIGDISISYAEK